MGPLSALKLILLQLLNLTAAVLIRSDCLLAIGRSRARDVTPYSTLSSCLRFAQRSGKVTLQAGVRVMGEDIRASESMEILSQTWRRQWLHEEHPMFPKLAWNGPIP